MKREIEWSKMTEKQLEIITHYCDNNMSELKKICDPILRKCNIPQMNYDELYDVAVDTLGKSLETYSKGKSQFKTFLTGNLKRKFIQWMRDDTRGCRCNVLKDENGNIIKDENDNNIPIQNISFDTPNEDGVNLIEIIDSGVGVENSIHKEYFSINNNFEDFSPQMKDYIRSLSKMQIRILEYIENGYTEYEIVEKLDITLKSYRDCVIGIKSQSKIKKIVPLIRRKK